METLTGQTVRSAVNSGVLGALLDKLVAIQMDLEPVCGSGGNRAPILTSPEAIASACDVLHSAIADMRNIIGQLDGLTLSEAANRAEAD